jgi:sugar-specific transcriptional regulator TrmB
MPYNKAMTQEQLEQLGLSPSQAKAYLLLVKEGKLTPAQLMAKTGESRTNAYMVLDRLSDIGLAIKDEVNKKLLYRAGSPMALQKLAQKARERAYGAEIKIKEAMPELLKFFHQHRTQPGVRFLQGREGLRQVYKDHLQVGGDSCVWRTQADDEYYGPDLEDYLRQRAAAGIKADMIAPDIPESRQFIKDHPELNMERTWVPADKYTAPVEVAVYSSRVAITSFGEEAVAMLIESPQIADAMRQIFAMAKEGAAQMARVAQSQKTHNGHNSQEV